MHTIDKVIVTTRSHGFLHALMGHRKRRVRRKWFRVLALYRNDIVTGTTETIIGRLRELPAMGFYFSPRGAGRVVRALNKCGHHSIQRAPRPVTC